MRVISGQSSGNALEVTSQQLKLLSSKQVEKILQTMLDNPMSVLDLSKALSIHEQTLYYYIRQLSVTKLIKIAFTKQIQGTIANYYMPSANAFVYLVSPLKEQAKVVHKESDFLSPFIKDGKFCAKIIVGSPDPHGPLKARSRDGYFGMDLALFLGSYVTAIDTASVILDTDIRDADLANDHLIILGGPIVNRVSALLSHRLPIYFDEVKKGFFSKASKKTYVSEEIGVICKCKSPFSEDKMILFIAGVRNHGTRAAILAFLRHFSKVEEPNIYDSKIFCKVVEGVDQDSDGVVDDVEILE
jgi:DNA-binding transcriptional ArsR family regulator